MEKIKHFNKERKNVDYLYVRDKGLKEKTIKSLGEISYTETEVLKQVVERLEDENKKLKLDIRTTNSRLAKLEAKLQGIERGLNLR